MREDEGQYTAEDAYHELVVAPFEKSIRTVSAPLAGDAENGGGVVATAAPEQHQGRTITDLISLVDKVSE